MVEAIKRNDGEACHQPPCNERTNGKIDNEKYPATISGSNQKKEAEKDGGSGQRKQRRCWSQELHRRFLNALKQLGGPHGAFLDFICFCFLIVIFFLLGFMTFN